MRLGAALVAVVVFCLLGSIASPASTIIWASEPYNSARAIESDGRDPRVIGAVADARGVAVHNGWGVVFGAAFTGAIQAYRLDGTPVALTGPYQNGKSKYAVDSQRDKFFYASNYNALYQADIAVDDPAAPSLVTVTANTAMTSGGEFFAMDLSSPDEMLFLGGDFGVRRLGYDNTGITGILSGSVTGRVNDLAVDPIRKKVYAAAWRLNMAGHPLAGALLRMNFDGTGLEVLVDGISSHQAVTLDPYTGKVYFSGILSGQSGLSIYETDLDGTNLRLVFEDSATSPFIGNTNQFAAVFSEQATVPAPGLIGLLPVLVLATPRRRVL